MLHRQATAPLDRRFLSGIAALMLPLGMVAASGAAQAAVSGKVVAHFGGESQVLPYDTTVTGDATVNVAVGVSTNADTFSQLSINTAAGTFSALVQSRASNLGGLDGGAIADIVQSERFVVSGVSAGAVGYLRFAMSGTLWENQMPGTGFTEAFALLQAALTTPDAGVIGLNYAWSGCSSTEPCDAAGYSSLGAHRFELVVPLVDGGIYDYSYKLRIRTFGDAMVDSSQTGRVYFELPAGVQLLDETSGQPLTFLSEQTYIPGVPEPATLALWAAGLTVLGARGRRSVTVLTGA